MKIKVLTVMIAVVIVRSNPIEHRRDKDSSEEDSKSSNYSFSYGVKDMHTGDVKDQWEKKEGDTVKGQYSMMEADGSIRTVEYVADKEHGFHAYVKYNGNSQHPISSSHQEVRMEAEKAPIKKVKPSAELIYKPSESRPQPSVVNLKPTKKTPPTTKKPLRNEKEITPTVQFPVDLSFLESNKNNKVIPVDISKLTPVEIKVKNEFTPQHQQQHYKKRKPTDNRFHQQFVETDFQPIISNLTYKVNNKRPSVTPGLRNYASSPNLKLALQQETQNAPFGNAYKYFPENRPNYYMQRPRHTVTKNSPTLISMKYF